MVRATADRQRGHSTDILNSGIVHHISLENKFTDVASATARKEQTIQGRRINFLMRIIKMRLILLLFATLGILVYSALVLLVVIDPMALVLDQKRFEFAAIAAVLIGLTLMPRA